MLANGVSVALAITLSIALVPHFGAVGAAIALTTAELGLALGYGVALKRSDPELLRRLGPVARILVGAALAFALPLMLGLHDILAVLVASVVYAIALIVLRAVPSELKDAVLGRVSGRPAA
jgi:O-antigen/teichoic acid export membrane protein